MGMTETPLHTGNKKPGGRTHRVFICVRRSVWTSRKEYRYRLLPNRTLKMLFQTFQRQKLRIPNSLHSLVQICLLLNILYEPNLCTH